jgi:chromosome segregation ATPase
MGSGLDEVRDGLVKLQRHLTSGKSDSVRQAEFEKHLKAFRALENSRVETDQQFKALREETDALREKLEQVPEINTEALEQQISDTDQRAQALEKQVEALSDIEKKLEALTAAQKDFAGKLASAPDTDHTASIKAFEEQLDEQNKGRETLTEKQQSIIEEQQALRERVDILQKESAEAGDMSKLEKQLKDMRDNQGQLEKKLEEIQKDAREIMNFVDTRFGEIDAGGPTIAQRLSTTDEQLTGMDEQLQRLKDFAAGFGKKTAEEIKHIHTRLEELADLRTPEQIQAEDSEKPKPAIPENFDEVIYQITAFERRLQTLEALIKMTSSRVQIIENARRGRMDDEET